LFSIGDDGFQLPGARGSESRPYRSNESLSPTRLAALLVADVPPSATVMLLSVAWVPALLVTDIPLFAAVVLLRACILLILLVLLLLICLLIEIALFSLAVCITKKPS
jgi:hypothetical protein